MPDSKKTSAAGEWLQMRDKWMRQLVADSYVSRNSKLVGVYLALRLSAKAPATYPRMKTMGTELGISTRQVARAIKELREEGYILVVSNPGHSSYYSLDL